MTTVTRAVIQPHDVYVMEDSETVLRNFPLNVTL